MSDDPLDVFGPPLPIVEQPPPADRLAEYGPPVPVPDPYPTRHMIFYDETTGDIIGSSSTNAPQWDRPHVEVESLAGITRQSHMVDPAGRRLVAADDAHRRRLNRVKLHEVQAAIAHELLSSDKTQLPDFAKKLTAEQRASWEAYRDALRQLSRWPDPVDRVVNWPARPDGADPIVMLRTRV